MGSFKFKLRYKEFAITAIVCKIVLFKFVNCSLKLSKTIQNTINICEGQLMIMIIIIHFNKLFILILI